MNLTKKQYSVLVHIDNLTRHNGYAPTYNELCIAMNIKSPSGIHRFVKVLKEYGYIEHSPHKAGGITIIKMPDNHPSRNEHTPPRKTSLSSSPHPMQPFFPRSPKFSQQPQQVEHASSQVPFQLRPSHSITLPLYGIIAAGPSIEAIKDHSSFIEIPASLVGHGQHYALEIEGNSMTQAAIISGDIAIIRQQNHADTGDIVVALTDEGEVTLKIFRIVNNMIHLEPANPDYKTIVMPPEKISIQGKLTNIFRSY